MKQYYPFQIGSMKKKKRIKIARMLQEVWKDENNIADVHVSILPWYMGEHDD